MGSSSRLKAPGLGVRSIGSLPTSVIFWETPGPASSPLGLGFLLCAR